MDKSPLKPEKENAAKIVELENRALEKPKRRKTTKPVKNADEKEDTVVDSFVDRKENEDIAKKNKTKLAKYDDEDALVVEKENQDVAKKRKKMFNARRNDVEEVCEPAIVQQPIPPVSSRPMINPAAFNLLKSGFTLPKLKK